MEIFSMPIKYSISYLVKIQNFYVRSMPDDLDT